MYTSRMKTKSSTSRTPTRRSVHIEFLTEEFEAIQRQAALEMRKVSAWIRKASVDRLKQELLELRQ